jgi:tetrahydromethanopterin S-methyltransferase subunit B
MDVFIGVVVGLSIASVIAIVLFCILVIDDRR